jgi:hypothetical protein
MYVVRVSDVEETLDPMRLAPRVVLAAAVAPDLKGAPLFQEL